MDKDRFKQCTEAYIKLGWKVLPLCYPQEGKCTCGRGCEKPGKAPHYKLCPNGSKQATDDPDVIQSWFDSGFRFNIGVCAGKASGLVIVDIDPGHGGERSLEKITSGAKIMTPAVATGSGGRHYYFDHPGTRVRNSAGKVGPGIDVRGHNGYVVAPPSMHACGGEYKWQIDPRAKLLPMPAWVQDKPKAGGKAGHSEVIAEGKRDNELTSIAGRLRRVGLGSEDIYIHLRQVNEKRCRPPKSEADLKRIAKSAGRYEPDANEDQDLVLLGDDHPDTIARAFKNWSIEHGRVKHRYHPEDGWTIYRDRQYQQVCPKKQISKYLSDFINKCVFKKGKKVERIRISDRKVSDVMSQLGFLDGTYLQPKYRAPASLDGSLDARHIIALKNGLLDWSVYPYRFMENTENYYTLNYLPYEWKGEKDSDLWLDYLVDVTDADVEMFDMLQMWAGYCLMPHLRMKQRFMLIKGEADTGKSVFCDVLRAMLGERNVSTVPLAKFDDPHFVIESYGKFLNLSDESEEMLLDRTVENNLKHYTGGTAFQWKRMYHDAFSAYPTAKLMISTNHLPKFTDSSEGIWTRLLYAPFNKVFPEHKQNKNLKEQLKATELPGILKWAIEGARKLQQNNFKFVIPEVSKEAVLNYRKEVNPELTFLEENIEECDPENTDLAISCKAFRTCYEQWCQANGNKPKSSKRIAPLLHKVVPFCQRKKVRRNGKLTYLYVGIKLKSDSEYYEEVNYE